MKNLFKKTPFALLVAMLALPLTAQAWAANAPTPAAQTHAALPTLPADSVVTLGTARVSLKNGVLAVTTGAVERSWQWTGKGLLTTHFADVAGHVEYAKKTSVACDWNLPGAISNNTPGQWLSTTCHIHDDNGFVSKHLEVISTIRYAKEGIEVQHVVWVFPGAPGIRTQLRLKALPGYSAKGKVVADVAYKSYGSRQLRAGARADYLPLDLTAPNSRRYWGYYNDPGNRLPASTPMLKEETVTGYPVFQNEVMDWASGMAVQYGDAANSHGVAVVKESAKTVNQSAYLTGSYFTGPNGLSTTGWGLDAKELVADRFRQCWATWSIVYSGGNDGLQKAVKQFDAARYPVFPKRDMFILSNTWGPANPGGAQFTAEKFVLKEIAAVGKLGIDVMQIDDGWQKSGGGSRAANFRPKYKNGWKDIRAAADKAGVKMGLWVAIRNAKMADLKKDLDELGFIAWKADFEHLANRSDYEARTAQYREVMKHAWMKTQFTLCPEYDDPRYGWYFAKEYGSIYFQNIQEGKPIHLTFVPFQVLRQHWLMSKYFPANKLQVMLQNPKRTRTDVSDARQHSHDYCFAMGLPFVPQFFQSAQLLDKEGQAQLTTLIAAYKKHRLDMFTSTTYPIGNEPNNASWSGFQMVSTKNNGGHLLLFRELHNLQEKNNIKLKFLAGKTILITDALHPGAPRTVTVANDGAVSFEIPKPADFLLLQYTIQ